MSMISFLCNTLTSIPVIGAFIKVFMQIMREMLNSNYFRETSTPLGALFMEKYDPKSLLNLEGQVAIVTGANSGLGLSTAKWLAKLEATVVLACRNLNKAETAKAAILEEIPNAKLDIIQLDLADLSSVEAFVSAFNKKYLRLDMLINNAGLHNAGYYPTKYGQVEEVWVVNHLSPSYLTFLLLDNLRATENSRIVFLGSAGMNLVYYSGGEAKSKEIETQHITPFYRYCDTKLAIFRFYTALSDKLRNSGDSIYVNCVHPGAVSTGSVRHAFKDAREKLDTFGLGFLMNIVDAAWRLSPKTGFAWDADTAALTTVHCAAAKRIIEEKVTGKYFVPIGRQISPLQDIGRSKDREDHLWDWTLEFLQKHTDFDGTKVMLSASI